MKTMILSLVSMVSVMSLAQAQGIQNQTVVTGTLSNHAGMPLYTFAKDSPQTVTCVGECAAIWPPALVPHYASPPAGLTMFRRDDQQQQFGTATGQPLYTFVKDTAGTATQPAVARGHGLNGFMLATPLRAK